MLGGFEIPRHASGENLARFRMCAICCASTASATMREANSSSASVARDRSGEAQPTRKTQGAGRFHHQTPHPPAMAKALTTTTISRPPRTPAPAPAAASPSGMTQHEEATTAPRPATSPNEASHFEAAGMAGGEVDGEVISSAASSTVMARPSFMVGPSCDP